MVRRLMMVSKQVMEVLIKSGMGGRVIIIAWRWMRLYILAFRKFYVPGATDAQTLYPINIIPCPD